MFDPDTVVLGGLFSRILPIDQRAARAELALAALHGGARDVLVVGAALGPQAVTVGAAELAFRTAARRPGPGDGEPGRAAVSTRRVPDPVLDIGHAGESNCEDVC